MLTPKAQVFVVDESRRVIAGPLVIARRRAYHREWLLGFVGVGGRAIVDTWRDQFLAVEAADAHD